jgi:hypothetical protein
MSFVSIACKPSRFTPLVVASFSEALRCFFTNSFIGGDCNFYNHYIFTISDKLLADCLKYSPKKKSIHTAREEAASSSKVINKTDKLLTKDYKSLTGS